MYEFAVNQLKLQRAIAELTKEHGKTPSEDIVKERYVKLAGLLQEEAEVKTAEPRKKMVKKSK